MKSMTAGMPFVFVVLAVCAPCRAADPIRDAAAAYGVAALADSPLDKAGIATWALVRFKPSARSGKALISRGGYVDEKTGKEIPRELFNREGGFEIVDLFAGSVTDKVGQFRFLYAPNNPTFAEEIRGGLPFVGDGALAVVRLNADGVGADRFSPIHIVPDAWSNSVALAVKHRMANAALFEPRAAGSKTEELERLARGDNPVSAVFALRSLAAADPIKALDVGGPLLHKAGATQAVAAWVFIRNASAPAAAAEGLSKIVEGADKAEEVGGLAIAAMLGCHRSNSDSVRKTAEIVARAIERRQVGWGNRTDADKYNRTVLDEISRMLQANKADKGR